MPSAAERTRTLVQSTCSAVVLLPGPAVARPEQLVPEERSVGPDGEVFLLFPADSPVVRAATHAQDDELAVTLEITDVAPVSVPNRIRGRAWVSGWLTCVRGVAEPGRMLVRLEVGEASVDDLWGTGSVEPEEFATAAADPIAEHEAELLQHLHSAHGDQVRQLCGLVGERAESGNGDGATEYSTVPVALDRFGLRVRFSSSDRHGFDGHSFDARFDFREPVRDIIGLRRAMHQLFEAAAH
ncbi:DUF2470 domain-containing protein [Streptomyces spiramyceticus]|uniref:DUF2470 domain-containing protein n=1 Tax=Streptomyces spiramyceticus TaxID=299717 RepID=UPI00237B2159|nr:DUF2470 domain-containing protein [Streptomyces spiramyceticus]